jgi:O-antigen/teichoic acid export membrane protein
VVGGGVGWLVGGYAAGVAVATLVGVVFLTLRPRLPRRSDFRRVVGFARYSWLSTVESRSFSAMDTVVLGVFVSSNLIGYYEVAWNLASILAVFGTSISETVFPAISRLESEDDREAVNGIVNDALAFTGLFVVPGLVGAAVVGEHVLRIYGAEFQRAALVLVVLVAARLVYAYEAQLVTALDAIDAPSRAFRVNLAFVVANLALNVLLVWQYGWVGAAVGTALAAAVGLVLAYRSLAAALSFDLPVGEMARQWAAALLMGGVVYLLEPVVVRMRAPPSVSALVLVGIGATTYFLALVALSVRFRATVRRNVPL